MESSFCSGDARRYLWWAAALLFLAAGCGEPFEAPMPSRDQLHYPVGMAVHPDGRFLYVVNSNFNARFRADSGGTVSVIDTHTLEIQREQTPFIPSFGGSIELNDDASRAYVTAREDNTLVSFEVGGDGGSIPSGGALFCRDQEGNPTSNPEPCTIREVPSDKGRNRLASDPFGLAVTTVRRENPDGEEVPIDLVNLAYLGSDRVSTLSLPNRDLDRASLKTASLVAGGNRIIQRPGTLNYYVAGRNSNVVARFSPFVNFGSEGTFGEVEALFRQGEIVLSNFVSQNGGTVAVNARGLAFDEDADGERLFVATRRPNALHTFNLVAEDRETGEGLAHEWTGTVPLPNGPSAIEVHETPEGNKRLYIPSFQDRSISVVDPDSQTVVDTIELDASPHEIVINTASNRCDSPGETCRAFVSLFQDTATRSEECGPSAESCGSVAVIDLDPASPRYHRVTQKIR